MASVAIGESLGAGPVWPIRDTARRPLALRQVQLTDGFLGDLQRSNSAASIVAGNTHLTQERAWENYRNAAAGLVGVEYHGPVFEDGEVYKWLEAVAWASFSAEDDRPEFLTWLDEYSDLIASAQAADGYLNTFFQVSGQREERYEDLAHDHEIFNMGAMIQSAVAQYRATGNQTLLNVARKAADHLDNTFGPDKLIGFCGHPVVEMALVELYRTTGVERYLRLASFFVEARGHRHLKDPRRHFSSIYFSDRIPVRETTYPEGHAVRAMYLAAAATDVAIETGDTELLAALQQQWDNMVAAKMYVTGGLGSRWEFEAFGDPYELPSDRAYAETCAAIASMQWSWRLYLATGAAKYCDLIERQLYNAALPGVSLDGQAYFYVNALQVRSDAVVDDSRSPAGGRQPWFGCSCCPTNLMRTVASVHHYLASTAANALQLNQYAGATVSATLPAGEVVLDVATNYPWDGDIRITVREAPTQPWTLSLRVPAWANSASVSINGDVAWPAEAGYHDLTRQWQAGDVAQLSLPMRPRLVRGHHRIDDVRGSVVIERGPLVYAIEQVDQPAGVAVDDIALVAGGELTERFDPDRLGGVPVVEFTGTNNPPGGPGYQPATVDEPAAERLTAQAIPYFTWANRGAGPMKVWLPVTT